MFSAREVVELVLLLRKKDHPSDETSTKKCGELVSVILDRFGMEAILWSSSICVTVPAGFDRLLTNSVKLGHIYADNALRYVHTKSA